MAYGRKAEDYLERGQFQRAVQAYHEQNDNAKVQIASLACAQDCLEVGLYERAMEYFEEGGRNDLANELKRICKDNMITRQGTLHLAKDPDDPRFLVILTFTYQEKQDNSGGSIDEFIGSEQNNFLALVKYVQEQDFIGKAQELKR